MMIDSMKSEFSVDYEYGFSFSLRHCVYVYFFTLKLQKCLSKWFLWRFRTIGDTFYWDTCSWKEQLEKNEKLESLKLESFCLSWKESSEVGKYRAKLEGFFWSWKVSLKLETFQLQLNFSTSPRTFQLRPELFNFNLSNFISDFPTSRSFQLPFPTTRIPSKTIWNYIIVVKIVWKPSGIV